MVIMPKAKLDENIPVKNKPDFTIKSEHIKPITIHTKVKLKNETIPKPINFIVTTTILVSKSKKLSSLLFLFSITIWSSHILFIINIPTIFKF